MIVHDVVVQVGMPATGVAMLRRALMRLRPQLAANGVVVAAGRDIDNLPHARGWRCRPDADEASAAAFAHELARFAAAEQSRGSTDSGRRPCVVVSSDGLIGTGPVGRDDALQFRPYATSAISQVLDALSPQSAQIVLYTYRQDRLMELSYLSRVRAGSVERFDEQFAYRFEPVLDYLDLIARLHAIPGVEEVVVRPWELVQAGTHALVNDFLACLGLKNCLDLYAIGADLTPYPRRYTAQGAHLALDLNAYAEVSAERKRIRQFLTANYSAPHGFLTDVLDSADRKRILDCYSDANRTLFQRYLADLPDDSYLNDAATFALGNVLDQPTRVEQPAEASGLAAPTDQHRRVETWAEHPRGYPPTGVLVRNAARAVIRRLRRARRAAARRQ